MDSEKLNELIGKAVEKAKSDPGFAASLKSDPRQAVADAFDETLSDEEANDFVEGTMRELLESLISEHRSSDSSEDATKALKSAFDAIIDGANSFFEKAEDVAEGRVSIDDYKRCVVTFAASELPRAGGGARCMTMPINRCEL